jgi:large subunit ribosomal protein L17
MRHLKEGRKLNRTNSHKKALMMNMAQSLIEHKKIHTTEAKAKELRPFIEKLITKAKTALAKEQQGKLPAGQTIDVHLRREVGKVIKRKDVLQELFDAIAPVVLGRNGGYTRIIKTGIRRGDAGETAIIELVDWSAAQDGASSFKRKKSVVGNKNLSKRKVDAPTVVIADTIEEAVVVETVAETPVEVEVVSPAEVEVEVVSPAEVEVEVVSPAEVVAEAPIVETPTSEDTEAKEKE